MHICILYCKWDWMHTPPQTAVLIQCQFNTKYKRSQLKLAIFKLAFWARCIWPTRVKGQRSHFSDWEPAPIWLCLIRKFMNCKQSPRDAHSRGSMGLWCVAWFDQSYIYKFLASLGGSLWEKVHTSKQKMKTDFFHGHCLPWPLPCQKKFGDKTFRSPLPHFSAQGGGGGKNVVCECWGGAK